MTITIDPYIPMDIKLTEQVNEIPLYWCIGDGHKSLLEFAISQVDGRLLGITIVSLNSNNIKKSDNFILCVNTERGFPIFDLTSWKVTNNNDFSSRFLDNFDCDIKIKIYEDSVMFTIFEIRSLFVFVECCDSLWLGLGDKKNVISFLIRNLSKENINKFYDSVLPNS